MTGARLIGTGCASLAAVLVAGPLAAQPAQAAPVCRPSGKVKAGYKGPRCRPGGLRLVAGGRLRHPIWSGSLGSSRRPGWAQEQATPGSIGLVRAPRAGWRHVTRFSVSPGDTPVPGGERSEFAASADDTGGDEGVEAWYAWSTYFPSNFGPVPASTFNVFTQFHQLYSTKDLCSPNVAFQVNTKLSPARIRLAVRGGSLNRTACVSQTTWIRDLVTLRTGRWYDFVFHVRWSSNPAAGFIELAIGRRTIVPRTTLATLYRGQRVYAKQGFYRAPSAQVSRVLQTGMTRFR